MESLPASTNLGTLVEGIALKPILLSMPAVLPSPAPIILGVQHLSACDLLSLDASLSYGSATRPFTNIKWSIDFDNIYLYHGLLQHDGSILTFIKRNIHFSTLLPNHISTVTITLRPSAPVEANSTIFISGIPGVYTSSRGCPSRSFELGRPCIENSEECIALDLFGPSAFLFSSHLKEDPLERQRVPVSWWQVGASQIFKA